MIRRGLAFGALSAACLLCGVFGIAAASAADPSDRPVPSEPKKVLIIDSFSPLNSPYDEFATRFRAELMQRAATPIAFYDISLDGAFFDPARDAGPFVRFLQERFRGSRPDLVIPLGPVANAFYAQHREELFPETPVLVAMAEERALRGVPLGPRDATTLIRLDIRRVFENILQVLPETSTIVVVIGDSPIEHYWINVVRAEVKSIEGRVSILYLNKLSLEAIEKQVASLPPHSAILFPQMYVDGAGVPHRQDRALAAIRAAANAPIFGLFASQLGKGIVGGPLISEQDGAMRAAGVASEMLSGAPTAGRAPGPLELGTPAYDWRELKAWGIPESRLPRERAILFRQPSLWEQHSSAIVVALVVVIVQSALVAGLLMQRARRRRAEEEALLLSGRILSAHEDEHRGLARELHDDVTPRLARLAIEAARTQRDGQAGPRGPGALSMHDELVRLSEDVHAFSYRLHPSVLDDLGLVDALRAECDRISHGQGIEVDLKVGNVPERMPREVALCLFRIAQEALRNIVRHAQARTASISLAGRDNGLALVIADDGVGFDPGGARERPSLGHASMRERVRQLDGDLRIRSAPGTGTAIVAWVPLPPDSP